MLATFSFDDIGWKTVHTAVEAVSYPPGSGTNLALQSPSAALGLPAPSTGSASYDGNFIPFTGFNIVQIGDGGELTLRLEKLAIVTQAKPALSVWESVFLVAGSGTAGTTTPPASISGADSCEVLVSDNAIKFVSIGTVTFNWFGNYWTDSPGPCSKIKDTQMADFGTPFAGQLADFNGKSYSEVPLFLEGTAGCTWIDLDTSELSQAGRVRFTGTAVGQTVELDSVTVNSSLLEATTVPESNIMFLVPLSFSILVYARRCFLSS